VLRDRWERVSDDDCDWEPDGWHRFQWLALPRVPLEELTDEEPPHGWRVLLPYVFEPAPSVLAEEHKPGQWLVPAWGGTIAAFPIGQAVKDVAGRIDKYLADHRTDPKTLPYWMVGD
jgi:hypothetical protein